jgi:hypothetical protein
MIKALETTSRAAWRWLNRLVRPSAPQLIERLYDDSGRLLWEKPYLFRCLFSEGQVMIAESVPITILSCRLDGNIVTTRVKLHKPWPNVPVSGGTSSAPAACSAPSYWGPDGRCVHCGAGNDAHHSYTCPTNMHPDKREPNDEAQNSSEVR